VASDDDFLDGMKNKEDEAKEWADAARFFIDVRQPKEHQQEQTKEAMDLRALGHSALEAARRFEPTGTIRAVTESKPAAIAGLAGAAAFGLGMGLSSRGKKELGGQSKLEHSLQTAKHERESRPEPKGFAGKITNNIADFNANLASTARKHPVKAGLLAGVGGIHAGTKLLHTLTGKG